MYRCCRVRRFLILLLCDALALAILLLIFRSGEGAIAEEEGVYVPVLMYHSVTAAQTGEYIVSPQAFAADLQYLDAHGYNTVLVSDLIAYVYDGTPLPEKPVVITFDDGFYNNLSDALPLLEQYDMCATISVVGSFSEQQAPQDSHHAAYSYLTAGDLCTLLDSGRIELGNHTYAMHSRMKRTGCAMLPNEPETVYHQLLRADLEALQALLRDSVGVAPVVFAYPYGFISRESIPVLRDMGFLATLTCYERPNLITRNPDCLFGLCRYHRDSAYTTEQYMQYALRVPNPE